MSLRRSRPPRRRLRRAFTALAACALLVAACGRRADTTEAPCPTLHCRVACDDAGARRDDATGCASCLCARGAVDGGSCPATDCAGTCGLGVARDPATGCATCGCCHPADCVERDACHGTGADGCPTCYVCR